MVRRRGQSHRAADVCRRPRCCGGDRGRVTTDAMAEGSMRAAVLTGAGKYMIRNAPLPEPGPGQVRVRLEGCGVCASNLTPWEGPEWMQFPTEPGALGHEGWGVVDALGDGVEDVAVGNRVAMLSGKAYAEHDLADASQLVKLPASL